MAVLSKTQAEAVYQAMTALNNIGVRLRVHGLSTPEHPRIDLHEAETGRIVVSTVAAVIESHPNQAAFAQAYDLS